MGPEVYRPQKFSHHTMTMLRFYTARCLLVLSLSACIRFCKAGSGFGDELGGGVYIVTQNPIDKPLGSLDKKYEYEIGDELHMSFATGKDFCLECGGPCNSYLDGSWPPHFVWG